MKTNVTPEAVAAAKRAWEELDPAVTSWAMRDRAWRHYAALKRIAGAVTVARVGDTPPRSGERWRAMAVRARGAR